MVPAPRCLLDGGPCKPPNWGVAPSTLKPLQYILRCSTSAGAGLDYGLHVVPLELCRLSTEPRP